jgi:hypothetical protein
MNTDKYFPIARKISEAPFMPISIMSPQIRMSRSTISRCIIRMYEEQRLVGPWLSMNPHENYSQYVYFMNFSDPLHIFEGLKGFPHVMYNALTFGEWNTLIIAEKSLEFSVLKGFQSEIWRGEKGFTYTPPVARISWEQSWREVKQRLGIGLLKRDEKAKKLMVLDWGEREWKLYHAFKSNMRQPVKPILRNLGMRYGPFIQWKKSLPEHCGIHTEFYPQPVGTFTNHCLLFKSRYIGAVEEVFSMFPTTPIFVEMGDSVLVYVKMTSDMTSNLIDMVYNMKERGIVEDARYAVIFKEHGR